MKVANVMSKSYAETGDKHPMYKRMRVHFSFDRESILDDFTNRRSRPHNELRKLLPEIFAQAGVHPDAIESCIRQSRWSQKAGCSCGCSPGFIVENLAGRQLFVDIK